MRLIPAETLAEKPLQFGVAPLRNRPLYLPDNLFARLLQLQGMEGFFRIARAAFYQ